MSKGLTKFFAFIGVVAILGGAVVGGMQLWAPTKYKPSNWGKHEQTENVGGDNKDDDGTLVITPDFSNGSVELAVAQYSLDGSLIENTIEDEEGNKITTYSSTSRKCTITAVAKNANGSVIPSLQAFAWELSDETAGVNMTVDGATATLECTRLFSEQLTLTVTSTIDRTKFATVKLDTLKYIMGVDYSLQGRSYSSSQAYVEHYIDIPYYNWNTTWAETGGLAGYREKDICFYVSPSVWSGGTLADEILSYTVKVNLSEEVKAIALEKVNANSYVGTKRTMDDFRTSTPIDSHAPSGWNAGDKMTVHNLLGPTYLFNWNSNSTEEGQGVFGDYLSAFYGLENQLEISVIFQTKYQGEVVINYPVTVKLTGYELQSVETDHSDGVVFF